MTPTVKVLYNGNYMQLCGVKGSYECDLDTFL